MRRRLLVLTATLAMAMGLTVPVGAQLPGLSVPLIMTDNVELVGAVPDATIVAATFDPLKPVMYTTTLSGFRTFDIADPEAPVLMGYLPFPHFSNENLKLGVRGEERFVLAGFDAVGYSPEAGATNVRGTNRFVVIDVSDPAAPVVASTVDTTNSTHTMGCVNAECSHAYTAGSGGGFDIFDLSDITAPEFVTTYRTELFQGNNTFGSHQGHDWDVDENGVAWLVGTGGIVAFDVSDPADPQILNSSDHRSREGQFNNYISHNSQRPDASAFTSRAPEDVTPSDTDNFGLEDRDPADINDGEVLFVTEEDLSALGGVCGGSRGSFQAWHVQELDTDRYAAEINPGEGFGPEPDSGSIAPIGQWTTEMGDDPFTNSNVATFCSAHYFDVHDSGIVAQAWYQQGLRILDARDPSDIKQIGFFVTGAQQIFGAKWVPEYDENGQTGNDTNLLYTEDPSRGIEILRVDLPEDGEDAPTVVAPILSEWRVTGAALAARANPRFGLCLLSGW